MPIIIEITRINILLALIAIVATITVPTILHILSKRKRKLICKLFPTLSLVDVRTEVKDKIKIYYNDLIFLHLPILAIFRKTELGTLFITFSQQFPLKCHQRFLFSSH